MRNRLILSIVLCLPLLLASSVQAQVWIGNVDVGDFYENYGTTGDATVNVGGELLNYSSINGGATVNGGMLMNNGTIYGNVEFSGGELCGGGDIGGTLTVKAGGVFDTNTYTGYITDFVLDGGVLNFFVNSLNNFSKLNILRFDYGASQDSSGGTVNVNFTDNFFTNPNAASFDLSSLFSGNAYNDSYDDWNFIAEGYVATVNNDGIVTFAPPAPPSGVPEPATLLILGLGSLATVPAIRKRMKKD